MYHLHQTDDLERAVRDHRELFNLDPDGPPTLVVVQSTHLQRWLARFMAQEQGIWFQPPIMTPDAALRCLLEGMETPDRRQPLYMDDLKYHSFRTLRRLARQEGFGRDWPVLARMLGAADSPAGAAPPEARRQFAGRRLYELADTIAGLFFTYSQMLWSAERGGEASLHLFRLWDRGHRLFAGAAPQLAIHEDWQARLYAEMFPPQRSWETLGCLTYQAAAEAWNYRGPWRRIVLFGSAFLSVQSFGFFRHLANLPEPVELYHFLLTPDGGLLPAPVADPPADPVAHWSALLAPFLKAAGAGGVEKASRFTLPDPLERPMRFFSCTTRLREVQSLKQNLLAEMARRRDTEEPLLPQDIAVMAPDIRAYRPWLEAWFPSRDALGRPRPDHLNLNLVDLDFGTGSAVIDALERLLDLPDSPLERSAVLGLLDNPVLAAAIGLDAGDTILVREWAARYEVRRGLNGRHRASLETGGRDNNTWDRALARLAHEVVQGDLPAGNAELQAIGRVAEFLHRVSTTLTAWAGETRKLSTWVRLLQEFMDQTLRADDPGEQAILAQARSAAANLLQAATPTGVEDSLDWLSFRLLYRDQLAHLSGARGQHQIDGITCSSLRPYRAVPFRLIAVLGMNEGEMPRPDPQVSFDLARVGGRSVGFISNPLQDNYAWLETLCSARGELWVWYNGRDPVADEELAPSPLVEETMAALEARGRPAHLVKEPVLPFDPDYFRPGAGERGLINTDPGLLGAARLLDAPPVKVGGASNDRLFAGPLGAADRDFLTGSDGNGIRVRVKDLVDFLDSPLRVHVRKRLGIHLDQDEDEAGQDLEPLDPPAWLGQRLIRDLTLAPDGLDSVAVVGELFDQETAKDRLYPGPVAERRRRQMELGASSLMAELSPLLATLPNGQRSLGYDIDFTLELEPAFPAALGGGPGQKVMVRVSDEIRDLLAVDGGGTAWMVTSSSDTTSASGIGSAKFNRLTVAMTLLRHLGQPLPTRLIHATIAPGAKKPAFALDIQDLGPFELDLRALVQAYLLNLVWPLPFYGKWLESLGRNLNGANAASVLPPDDTTDYARSWNDWWQNLTEPFDSGNDWGAADHPLRCAYFGFLSRGAALAPAWQPWYRDLLETVWLPALRRQRSFIAARGGAKKKAAA